MGKCFFQWRDNAIGKPLPLRGQVVSSSNLGCKVQGEKSTVDVLQARTFFCVSAPLRERSLPLLEISPAQI